MGVHWQMSVDLEKCTVLRITTGKRQCRQTSYYLHGQLLEVADGANYLCVSLSDDLQWAKHTHATAAKTFCTLEFLRRKLRGCSKAVFETIYRSMIRPTSFL
jgi:hypothetical protein